MFLPDSAKFLNTIINTFLFVHTWSFKVVSLLCHSAFISDNISTGGKLWLDVFVHTIATLELSYSFLDELDRSRDIQIAENGTLAKYNIKHARQFVFILLSTTPILSFVFITLFYKHSKDAKESISIFLFCFKYSNIPRYSFNFFIEMIFY